MRTLITGGGGYLGRALVASAPDHHDVHVTWRRTPADHSRRHHVDLDDPGATAELVESLMPEVIVHTAAAMDHFERDIEAATRSVASAAAVVGARLVHMSSDLVFDGGHAPYDEDAAPRPVHAYGRAKAAAEESVRRLVPHAALIRTSLLIGTDPLDPRSQWVADALRSGEPITLFTDEVRCPIAVDDLAAQVWEIVAMPPAAGAGFWHLAGPEAVTRHRLGLVIAAHLGLDPMPLVPGKSAVQPEPRPRDVRLVSTRAARLSTRPGRPVEVFPPA